MYTWKHAIVSSFRQEACDVEVLLQLPYRVCCLLQKSFRPRWPFHHVLGGISTEKSARMGVNSGHGHRSTSLNFIDFEPNFPVSEHSFWGRFFMHPDGCADSWHKKFQSRSFSSNKKPEFEQAFFGDASHLRKLRIRFCGRWRCGSEILNPKRWFKGNNQCSMANQYTLDISPPYSWCQSPPGFLFIFSRESLLQTLYLRLFLGSLVDPK